MKNCTNCGKENLDEAVFCAGCGTPLPTEVAPEAPVAPVAPEAPVAPAAPVAAETPSQTVDASAYSAPAAAAPAESNKATLWLILNIVVTVLCCLTNVFSIIGIVFAGIGMSSYNKGNYEDMKSKSKISMIMFIIAVVVGIIVLICSFAGMFALPFLSTLAAIASY